MPEQAVAILIPVLGRPHRIAPVIESIRAATPQPHRILFIASPGDHAVHRAIATAQCDRLLVEGNYAQKINAGVAHTDEPLIFTAADDLAFHAGWLPSAARLMSDTIGVVGTNDQCNGRVIAGEHSTHTLVARWYAELGTIDEPGKLLHEGYLHEWVDDELVGTAKYRGAYAHAHDSIVEHLHPDAGKAPLDEMYAARGRRMRRSRTTFECRRAMWTRP